MRYTVARVSETVKHDDLLPYHTLERLAASLHYRREGQRFFSSLVNEPCQSHWAAIDGVRCVSALHSYQSKGAQNAKVDYSRLYLAKGGDQAALACRSDSGS